MNKKLPKWVNLWESPFTYPWYEAAVSIFETGNKFKHLPGCKTDYVLYIYQGKGITAYHALHEIDSSGEWGKKAHDNHKLIRNYITEAYKIKDQILEFLHKVELLKLKKLDNVKVSEILEEFYYFAMASTAYYKLCNDEFQVAVGKEIEEWLLREVDSNEASQIIQDLSTDSTIGTLEDFDLKLHSIALRILENNLNLNKLPQEITQEIQLLSDDYGWIGVGAESGDYWDFNHNLNEINKIMGQNDLESIKSLYNFKKNRKKIVESKITQIKEKYSVPEKFILYGEQMGKMAHLKSELRLCWAITDYKMQPFLEHLKSVLNVTGSDLNLLQMQEVLDFLHYGTALPLSTFAQRRKACMYLIKGGCKEFYFGDEALEKFEIEIPAENYSNMKEVRGMIACKGIVQGTVKVVSPLDNQSKALAKVSDSDILVTGMTRPHMLPAMKKAAAFVTDEGGITCHAAIISREMNKPCVIATRVATKIFKDGDLVEVDADKGIVKILERNN
jgi:pyruvate,water dikinase